MRTKYIPGINLMGGIDIKIRKHEQSLTVIKQEVDKEDLLKTIWEVDENTKRYRIEEIPTHEINNKSVYLPHHAVIRNDKETTKIRVVFNASCKGCNGASINDELLTGPVLQDDL
ncbi:unnamed protein product [Pieris macdunnoughi]|uniref:Uncharacterized protein n=1 Tax=Pieris macdunnoughi TaxID=345717 RepID=A0A821R0T2_9NEOP|nr:unnamed protein product [Pieris macdunnoughi]